MSAVKTFLVILLFFLGFSLVLASVFLFSVLAAGLSLSFVILFLLIAGVLLLVFAVIALLSLPLNLLGTVLKKTIEAPAKTLRRTHAKKL